jgi:hypothetical protein
MTARGEPTGRRALLELARRPEPSLNAMSTTKKAKKAPAKRKAPAKKAPAKVGRKTKFTHAMIEPVMKAAAAGATDREVAMMLGIAESTLYRWKNENAEFRDTLKAGCDFADAQVQGGLYRRACGFTDPAGTYHPPHPTAAIFWLKNRRPDQWRDVTRSEITGVDGAPVALQGPPRPSSQEVTEFAAELHKGFHSFTAQTGECADLAAGLPLLAQAVATFAAGEPNPSARSARETGAFLAQLQLTHRTHN